jgi:hypothetical protein
VAGDPAIGNAFLAHNWNEQVVLQDTTTYIDQNALALLDHAVLTECDGLDGVVDGLIQTWVEHGVAPDGIIASHYINDDSAMPIDRTMTLCSYPEEAQYNGIGPVNTASSWSCSEPGASTAR